MMQTDERDALRAVWPKKIYDSFTSSTHTHTHNTHTHRQRDEYAKSTHKEQSESRDKAANTQC